MEEGISLIVSDKKKEIGVYYPSENSYCARKIYYSYLHPSYYDFDTHSIFAIGSAYHSIIQRGLAFYAKEHPEIKVISEPEENKEEFYYSVADVSLHGRPDSIITIGKETYVLEIKSYGGNLAYLKEPKENHVMQANFYLHSLPKAKALILYASKIKDSEKFKVFEREYDEEKFQLLVQQSLDLHKHLINKIIPKPEAYLKDGWEGWECKSCSFKKMCMKAVKKEKAI